MRSFLSWRTWPSLVENGFLLKILSRSPSLTNVNMKFLLPPLQVWNTICHQHKGHKDDAFFWSIIHKTSAVINGVDIFQWRSTRIVPIVARRQWNRWSTILLITCWLSMFDTMHNIIWQFFAKRGHLDLMKSFSMLQCLFDRPLTISLKHINHIWFFSRSGLPMD